MKNSARASRSIFSIPLSTAFLAAAFGPACSGAAAMVAKPAAAAIPAPGKVLAIASPEFIPALQQIFNSPTGEVLLRTLSTNDAARLRQTLIAFETESIKNQYAAETLEKHLLITPQSLTTPKGFKAAYEAAKAEVTDRFKARAKNLKEQVRAHSWENPAQLRDQLLKEREFLKGLVAPLELYGDVLRESLDEIDTMLAANASQGGLAAAQAAASTLLSATQIGPQEWILKPAAPTDSARFQHSERMGVMVQRPYMLDLTEEMAWLYREEDAGSQDRFNLENPVWQGDLGDQPWTLAIDGNKLSLAHSVQAEPLEVHASEQDAARTETRQERPLLRKRTPPPTLQPPSRRYQETLSVRPDELMIYPGSPSGISATFAILPAPMTPESVALIATDFVRLALAAPEKDIRFGPEADAAAASARRQAVRFVARPRSRPTLIWASADGKNTIHLQQLPIGAVMHMRAAGAEGASLIDRFRQRYDGLEFAPESRQLPIPKGYLGSSNSLNRYYQIMQAMSPAWSARSRGEFEHAGLMSFYSSVVQRHGDRIDADLLQAVAAALESRPNARSIAELQLIVKNIPFDDKNQLRRLRSAIDGEKADLDYRAGRPLLVASSERIAIGPNGSKPLELKFQAHVLFGLDQDGSVRLSIDARKEPAVFSVEPMGDLVQSAITQEDVDGLILKMARIALHTMPLERDSVHFHPFLGQHFHRGAYSIYLNDDGSKRLLHSKDKAGKIWSGRLDGWWSLDIVDDLLILAEFNRATGITHYRIFEKTHKIGGTQFNRKPSWAWGMKAPAHVEILSVTIQEGTLIFTFRHPTTRQIASLRLARPGPGIQPLRPAAGLAPGN